MINAFKQIRLTNYGVSGANGRLNVNASGLAYYSELTGVSGVLQSNIASTGSTLKSLIDGVSGSVVSLSGTLTGTYATTSYVNGVSGGLSTRLIATGNLLENKIGNLSGTLTGLYATTSFVNGVSGGLSTRIIDTGNILENKINNLSGTLTGQYLLSSTAASTYATAANLVTTGGTLQTQINNLSGTLINDYILTATADATYATKTNLANTGSNLQTQINNLGNTYVTLGTNQTISGVKTFTNTVYIKDLFVTGAQTIVNTQVTNVGSNYLNLNATGGARDGGLFINMSTGASTSGAYIGFDIPSNTFRIGTGVSGLADLSVLDTIATQAYVSSFTASATSGAVLMTNVAQTISGNKTFVNALNLNTQASTTGHAVRADRSITAGNGLTGGGNLTSDRDFGVGQGYGISVTADAVAVNTSEVVVTTGTQTIAGSKTFSSAVTLSTQATATGHAVAAARTITAGNGLSGGGDLTADRTLNIGQGYGITVNADDIAVNTNDVVVTTGSQTINGTKTFYEAPYLLAGATGVNQVARAGTSIIAGSGLAGGGNLISDRTLDVGQGYGISVSADSVAVNTSEVVVTTGTQTIGGDKSFQVTDFEILYSPDLNGGQQLGFGADYFYLQGYTSGPSIDLVTGTISNFGSISATNISKGGFSVLTTNDTGNFASTQNLASTGSNLQTQITNLSGTLTGNYVTTQFASATYATLVALNQKINWVSGQSQAFTVGATTGVDTQFVSFPAAFTGGTIPTVQVTLDIPSNSEYMYNVAVRNITTSGFTALYSDTVLESNVVLNVWASKLYGSI